MPYENPRHEDENPYYAEETEDTIDPDLIDEDAEEIRNTYLKHEASIQSIGSLYFIGGALVCLAAIAPIVLSGLQISRGIPNPNARGELPPAILMIMGFLYALIGGLQIWIGYGLRTLRNWARITAGVISIPGLLGVPFGTAICGYILYLVFSEKGKFVCSPEYHRVVAATPHIRYKTSIIVIVLLVLLLLLLAIGVLGLIFGGVPKR